MCCGVFVFFVGGWCVFVLCFFWVCVISCYVMRSFFVFSALSLLLCGGVVCVFGQDKFKVSRDDVGGGDDVVVDVSRDPMEPIKLVCVEHSGGERVRMVSDVVVCEQLESGDLRFSFNDGLTGESVVIEIPSVDSNGYYPVKQFLKDVWRDRKVRYEKCRQQLASRYRYYKAGKDVELSLVPWAVMRDKRGRELVLGMRPVYVKRGAYFADRTRSGEMRDGVYFDADVYLQIRESGRVKVMKCVDWLNDGKNDYAPSYFTKWLAAALRKQAILNKK